jgi:hypothetical protein
MAGIITNIVQNSLAGFVGGAVTTVGGYAGSAVNGVGNLIEGAGESVGNGSNPRLPVRLRSRLICKKVLPKASKALGII